MRILLWCVVGLLVAVLALAAWGFSRLRAVSGQPGSFESAWRGAGLDVCTGWQAGFAVYQDDRLDWWRSWSLRPRPQRQWLREELAVISRSEITDPEAPDLWLVRCRCDDATFDLTMSDGAYAGFSSWLESAPPNRRYPVV
ncbi:DUF2550 domain-containing protein [Sanguibacter sp. 25GB23B1]|uniref:DUF2550 domain-containing protein n=1 Tax=unclassified Sanguibacter TaxID=2645534 RepID=UPI0032AF3490